MEVRRSSDESVEFSKRGKKMLALAAAAVTYFGVKALEDNAKSKKLTSNDDATGDASS